MKNIIFTIVFALLSCLTFGQEKEISVSGIVHYNKDISEYLISVSLDLNQTYGSTERYVSFEELEAAYLNKLSEEGLSNIKLNSADSDMAGYSSHYQRFYLIKTASEDELVKISRLNFPLARVSQVYAETSMSVDKYKKLYKEAFSIAEANAKMVAEMSGVQLGDIKKITVQGGEMDSKFMPISSYNSSAIIVYVSYDFEKM